jgi:hypothetical protein
MRRLLLTLSFATTVMSVSPAAQAVDPWDAASVHDDAAASTNNVLWHTAPAQIHDLKAQMGVADQDWFRIYPRARRSYEVQIVNVTGDTGIDGVRRYAADGATLLQTGVALDQGASLSTLRWIHGPRGAAEFVQVLADGLNPSVASKYSIQLRETTAYCARYSNVGGQISSLLIQRTDPDNSTPCSYEVRYNTAAGVEVGSSTGTLAPVFGGNTMSVIATQSEPGVGGTSGSAFIAHSCGYGGINAKVVQLEPTTGFSFDTACVTRTTN